MTLIFTGITIYGDLETGRRELKDSICNICMPVYSATQNQDLRCEILRECGVSGHEHFNISTCTHCYNTYKTSVTRIEDDCISQNHRRIEYLSRCGTPVKYPLCVECHKTCMLSICHCTPQQCTAKCITKCAHGGTQEVYHELTPLMCCLSIVQNHTNSEEVHNMSTEEFEDFTRLESTHTHIYLNVLPISSYLIGLESRESLLRNMCSRERIRFLKC